MHKDEPAFSLNLFIITMNLSIKESVYQMLLKCPSLSGGEVCNGLFQSARNLLFFFDNNTTWLFNEKGTSSNFYSSAHLNRYFRVLMSLLSQGLKYFAELSFKTCFNWEVINPAWEAQNFDGCRWKYIKKAILLAVGSGCLLYAF